MLKYKIPQIVTLTLLNPPGLSGEPIEGLKQPHSHKKPNVLFFLIFPVAFCGRAKLHTLNFQ